MKTLPEILSILKSHDAELRKRFFVSALGVFGSYARGEQRPDSDVDVLVDFSKPVGFFHFLELEEYLQGLLGAPVDLVTRKALKPAIGRHILQDVVYA